MDLVPGPGEEDVTADLDGVVGSRARTSCGPSDVAAAGVHAPPPRRAQSPTAVVYSPSARYPRQADQNPQP